MGPPPATLRLLRLTGLLAWLLVAAPPAVEGMERPAAFWAWLGSMTLFGALYAWATARLGSPGPAVWASLLAQSACVIGMSAAQYHGLEGTLLVLLSLELGLVAPPRVGLAWIAAQSLGLAWAIQHHWSLRPALMFLPPYGGFQVLTFMMVRLLDREARAREALARTNTELVATRELLAENARLGERLRIARELHDAMGHHLAGLSLNLEVLAQRQGTSPPLETARSLTRQLLDDVESLVDTLGQERELDLSGALTALAVDIPRPRVHLDVTGVAIPDPRRSHALWRCCQEIVTNAVKHSEAENLWIAIRVRDGQVELTARDDGGGASRLGQGQGLLGMRQRLHEMGGALQLETAQGAGFLVRVTLPTGTA
jgi:signal transduction histidine kinase